VNKDTLVPQQERSRETLVRLLRATIQIMDKHGLDDTTIPLIAATAGLSPGSVYRRFKDKEALVRAAFLSVLKSSVEANRTALVPEAFRNKSLEETAKTLVTAIMRQYRAHPNLLGALNRYLGNQREKRFQRQAADLIAQNFRRLVDILLLYRKQIAHPDPEFAISFALLQATTAIEIVTLESWSLWQKVIVASDEQLKTELTRSLVTYLRDKSTGED